MVKNEDVIKIGGAVAGGYLIYNSFFGMDRDEALSQTQEIAEEASKDGKERNETAADPDVTEEELDSSIKEAKDTKSDVYSDTSVQEPKGTSVDEFIDIIDSEEDAVTAKRLKLMELNGQILRGQMEQVSEIAEKAQATTTVYDLWENKVEIGLTVMGVAAGLGLMGVAVAATFATGGAAIAPALSAFGAGLGTIFLSINNAKEENLLRFEKLTEREKAMIEFSQRRIEMESLIGDCNVGSDIPRIDTQDEPAMVVTDACSAYHEADMNLSRTMLPITLTDVFTMTQYNDTIAYNVDRLLEPMYAIDTTTEEEVVLDIDWAKSNPGLTGLLIYGYISRAVDFDSKVVGDQAMSTLIGGFSSRDDSNLKYAFDSEKADEVSGELVEILT